MSTIKVAPKLHHIALKTDQFQEMCEFYRSLLHFQPTLEIDQVVGFYTFDLVHHRLVIFHDPLLSSEPARKTGMHHVAFSYDTVDDFLHVYKELRSKDIYPFVAVDHGPNTAFYYYDPDYNVIELEIDNYADEPQKALDFMANLNRNPELFTSDPSVMFMAINTEAYLQAWESGATQKELHERSYQGEFVEGAQIQPLPEGFNPAEG